MRKKFVCPVCGGINTEEHGTAPGDFRWWLCRDCGWNTPREEKGEQNDERKL